MDVRNNQHLKEILERQEPLIKAVPSLVTLYVALTTQVELEQKMASLPSLYARERLSPAVRAKYRALEEEFSVHYKVSLSAA